MHERNIICGQTQLNVIAHEQTIICTQLFAGHVEGFRVMKRKKNWYRIATLYLKQTLEPARGHAIFRELFRLKRAVRPQQFIRNRSRDILLGGPDIGLINLSACSLHTKKSRIQISLIFHSIKRIGESIFDEYLPLFLTSEVYKNIFFLTDGLRTIKCRKQA